jgi:VanZ family protein
MIERLWWIAGWFGVALTVAFSLMPPVLDSSGSHTDKLVHLTGYAVLMFWWAQLVVGQRWKLAVAIVLLGIAIELLQGLTPNRQPDVLDALANSAGVLIGWLVARLLATSPVLPRYLATLPALRR